MRNTFRYWAFCALALLSVLHAVGQSRLNYTSPCDASTGGEFFFTIDWVKITNGRPGIKFTFNIKTGNTFRYGNTQFTRSQVGFTDADILVKSSTYYFNVDIYYKGVKQSTITQATMSAGKDPYNGWGVVEKGYTGFFPDLTSEKAESMFKDAIELKNIQLSTRPFFNFSDNLLAKLKKLEEGNAANSKPSATKPATSAPNTTNAAQTSKPQSGSSSSKTTQTSTQTKTNNATSQKQQALENSKRIEQESYRKLQESSNNLARGLQVVFGNKVDQEKRQQRLAKEAADRKHSASMVGEYYFGHTWAKLQEFNKISQVCLENPAALAKGIGKSLSETTTFTNKILSKPDEVGEFSFSTDLSLGVWSRPSDDRLGTNNFIMKKSGSYCLTDMIQLLGISEMEIDRIMFHQFYSVFMQNVIIENIKCYQPFFIPIHDYVYNIKDLDKKQNFIYFKIKPQDTTDYFWGAADLTRYKFIEKYRSNKNVYENRNRIKGSPLMQPVYPDMNREIGYIDFDKTSFQYEDISKKYTDASARFMISNGKVVGVSQFVDTSSINTSLLKEKGWILFGDALLNKSERSDYNSSIGKMRLHVNAWYPGVILAVTEIRKKGGGIYGMHVPYEPYDPGTISAEYAEITTLTYDPSIEEYNAAFNKILKAMKANDRLAQINIFLSKYPDNILGLYTKFLMENASKDEIAANQTKAQILKIIGKN